MNPSLLKRICFVPLAVACAFCASAEPPSPPDDLAPFEEDGDMPPPLPPPRQMERFTHRWLDTLREENPEQYRECMALREENPEAFRDHLAAQLDRKRMLTCLTNFPAFSACYTALSEEEQTRIAAACFARPPMMELNDRHHPPENRGDGPRMNNKQNMKTFRALIKLYRATDDNPETKEALRQQILVLIGQRFDERTEERRNHLLLLNKQLDDFQKKLDQQIENRDRIIQEHFERLTAQDEYPDMDPAE